LEKTFRFEFSNRSKISFDIEAEQYMTVFRIATQLSNFPALLGCRCGPRRFGRGI